MNNDIIDLTDCDQSDSTLQAPDSTACKYSITNGTATVPRIQTAAVEIQSAKAGCVVTKAPLAHEVSHVAGRTRHLMPCPAQLTNISGARSFVRSATPIAAVPKIRNQSLPVQSTCSTTVRSLPNNPGPPKPPIGQHCTPTVQSSMPSTVHWMPSAVAAANAMYTSVESTPPTHESSLQDQWWRLVRSELLSHSDATSAGIVKDNTCDFVDLTADYDSDTIVEPMFTVQPVPNIDLTNVDEQTAIENHTGNLAVRSGGVGQQSSTPEVLTEEQLLALMRYEQARGSTVTITPPACADVPPEYAINLAPPLPPVRKRAPRATSRKKATTEFANTTRKTGSTTVAPSTDDIENAPPPTYELDNLAPTDIVKIESIPAPIHVVNDINALQRTSSAAKRSRITSYPCYFCKRTFRRRSSQQAHIRVHTGETKHKCRICRKGFAYRRALGYHIRKIHSGSQEASTAIACFFCSKTFLSTKERDKHCRKEHKTRRYHVCDICNTTFYTMGSSTFIDVTLMASNALKENESRKSSATFATNRAKLEKHFKFTCATTRESGRTSAKCVKRASYRLKCGMDTCVYIWPSSFAIATRANSAMRALHTSAALIAI